MNYKYLTVAIFCVALFTSIASAQEIKTETVIEGLNRPASLAIHPVDNSIYVAEFGANRIVKIADGKPKEIVTEFSSQSHSSMDSDGGPVLIEFLNANWLLVGAATEAEKPFQVQGFDLSTIKEDKPLAAAEANATLEIGETETTLNGSVTGMVVGSASVLVSGQENGDKAFIAMIAKSDAKPEAISLLFPEKLDAEKWLKPSGSMTISVPEGYLAFIQATESGSTLTFYTEEGEENGTFDTGLKKVTAMAYGPNRGRLFLADRETGAIYKLIESDNDAGCESVKVHELANVSDMRFNAAGELLVVTLGESVGDESGQVLKLIGFDSVDEETKEGE